MTDSKKMNSYRKLFKNENFIFQFLCIFSVLFYMLKNRHLFPKNLEVLNNDSRSANIFHLHFTNLTK